MNRKQTIIKNNQKNKIMSKYQTKGTVAFIGETESVGASEFKKRMIAITTTEQYPQTVGIQFVQANTNKLDGIRVGELVTIDFDVRGNEYQGKYYVTLQGWRIEADRAASAPIPPIPMMPPTPDSMGSAVSVNNVEDDDLPF